MLRRAMARINPSKTFPSEGSGYCSAIIGYARLLTLRDSGRGRQQAGKNDFLTNGDDCGQYFRKATKVTGI
jgi:hypothetical protein